MCPFDDEEKQDPTEALEPGTYCDLCKKTGRWLHLMKCPMCHTYYCDQCSYRFGGKTFCSRPCANEFYWGGDDSDVE